MKLYRSTSGICLTVLVAALAACGGGGVGDAASANLTVTGTAATGLAIAGATVTGKCKVGTGTATTLANGTFTLVVADGQLPCVLQITNPADGGTKLHTLVSGTGNTAVANITPLTEMTTARVLGSEPNVFFAAFDAAAATQKVTTASIAAAQTAIDLVFTGTVDTTPIGDFITTPLVAATQGSPSSGDAQDKLLDALKLKLTSAQIGTIATALASNQTTDAIKQTVISLTTAPLAPPVANAGTAQSVVAGSVVTLNGSGSSDANGDALTYDWTLTSRPDGSMATLCCYLSVGGGHSSSTSSSYWQDSPAPLDFGKANTVKPTFSADVAGTYVARLIVSDGKVSSTEATVAITVPVDANAPTTPTGLTVTAKTSNSVTLTWNAATGGAGGVYSYHLYRNGHAIGGMGYNANTALTYTDLNLTPGRTHSYSIAATSVSGAKSLSSTVASVTTMDLSLLKAKLTPFIVFETATGKILGQAYASPGVIAAAAPLSGYSVVAHTPIDTATHGIRSIGVGQYVIYLYATGAIVEQTLTEMVLNGISNDGASYVTIDLTSGQIRSTGYGQTSTLFMNIAGNANGGGYLDNEIL